MRNRMKIDEHESKAPKSLAAAALLGACVVSPITVGASRQYAQSATPTIRNVILVHGAFADGSSYARVIPLLDAKGLHVTAVQNPLTSLADDVAATKRAIANQDGPVILVGHS
jgi:pimeloyl-ACP methyl ester carboxylesterase